MKFFKPAKVITRDDNTPYLIRRTLFECRFFSIKLHNILISDDDCLHDHPWAFITFLLKGGYVEYKQVSYERSMTQQGPKMRSETTSRLYGRFSLLYRPAHYTHRLEIHQPVTSLVITFKKQREWGFFTGHGWVKWFNYRSSGSRCD